MKRALPAVLALCASCITVHDAKVWNLREMHNPDGSFRRVGATVSDWEYLLRFDILSFTDSASRYQNPSQKGIEDPAGKTFEELRELSRSSLDDPRKRRDQIEWFAFLGVSNPWRLSRERSVIELGKIGAYLAPETITAPPAEEATADEVREAMRAIIAGTDAILKGDDGGREGLSEGCAALRELELSYRGSLSTVRALGSIEDGLSRKDARFQPLFAASQALQLRLLQLALLRTLEDPDPVVVAAAIDACWRTWGGPILERFLIQLFAEQTAFADEVLLAVLQILRDEGLPEPSPASPLAGQPAEREILRMRTLELLIGSGTGHASGAVRLASLQALNTLTGLDFGPREEEWVPWWTEERERFRLKQEEAERAELEAELKRQLEAPDALPVLPPVNDQLREPERP